MSADDAARELAGGAWSAPQYEVRRGAVDDRAARANVSWAVAAGAAVLTAALSGWWLAD